MTYAKYGQAGRPVRPKTQQAGSALMATDIVALEERTTNLQQRAGLTRFTIPWVDPVIAPVAEYTAGGSLYPFDDPVVLDNGSGGGRYFQLIYAHNVDDADFVDMDIVVATLAPSNAKFKIRVTIQDESATSYSGKDADLTAGGTYPAYPGPWAWGGERHLFTPVRVRLDYANLSSLTGDFFICQFGIKSVTTDDPVSPINTKRLFRIHSIALTEGIRLEP